jgi:uncharacterized protein Smg (DUF494 family)
MNKENFPAIEKKQICFGQNVMEKRMLSTNQNATIYTTGQHRGSDRIYCHEISRRDCEGQGFNRNFLNQISTLSLQKRESVVVTAQLEQISLVGPPHQI